MNSKLLPTPEQVFNLAVEHGFYDNQAQEADKTNIVLRELAHLHSEVSEVFQCIREHGIKAPYLGAGTGCLGEELADIILVTLGISKYLDIDIEGAIIDKHRYNSEKKYKYELSTYKKETV